MKIRFSIFLAALLIVMACESPAESTLVNTPEPQPTAILSPTAAPAVPTPSVESLIMLQDPLDEPEFYCVDVAGFGSNLNLNSPLQAHTCKPGADDELFIFNAPGTGQFFMDAYNFCLEAEEGLLYARKCSDAPAQRFVLGSDGAIRAHGADLCLAVQSGAGQPAGGRSHLRRDLLLQSCADVAQNLSRWLLPGPSP